MTEEDDRPWEQPGNFRRDLPPHRVGLLRTCATVCLATSVLLCCLAPVGFVATVLLLLVVQEDIRQMAAGQRDPSGLPEMREVERLAWAAYGLSLFTVAGDLALVVLFVIGRPD